MRIAAVIILCFFALQVFSQTGTVITEKANMRGTPSEKGRVVVELERGTAIELVQQKEPWFLVQSPEYVGWMHGNTIKFGSSIETIGGDVQLDVPRLGSLPNTPRPSRARSTPQSSAPVYAAPSRGGSYIRGPRGGCYYINANGNKTYVSRSLCN